MYSNLESRNNSRKYRTFRVRKKLRGTEQKPRLSVLKSNKHLSVQLIDDEKGITLASFGTLSKECTVKTKSKESAKQIGKKIAELATQKNIKNIVFDRGPYKYPGLIAELANSARESGLKF